MEPGFQYFSTLIFQSSNTPFVSFYVSSLFRLDNWLNWISNQWEIHFY